jgi:hypothetical protein
MPVCRHFDTYVPRLSRGLNLLGIAASDRM